jgi:hypothetical protein
MRNDGICSKQVCKTQTFANNQPVTFAVTAARHFALGSPSDGAEWKLLLWIIGLLIVFVPLSVFIYKRRV